MKSDAPFTPKLNLVLKLLSFFQHKKKEIAQMKRCLKFTTKIRIPSVTDCHFVTSSLIYKHVLLV